MPQNPFSDFKALVDKLKKLVQRLPKSIPLATEKHRIHEVFTNIPIPSDPSSSYECFNKRMDALYAEDLRQDGKLPNVYRGPYGLDLVAEYFEKCVDVGALPWDIAAIKVQRIVDELTKILYVLTPS